MFVSPEVAAAWWYLGSIFDRESGFNEVMSMGPSCWISILIRKERGPSDLYIAGLEDTAQARKRDLHWNSLSPPFHDLVSC